MSRYESYVSTPQWRGPGSVRLLGAETATMQRWLVGAVAVGIGLGGFLTGLFLLNGKRR